jgi:hypothetical protein
MNQVSKVILAISLAWPIGMAEIRGQTAPPQGTMHAGFGFVNAIPRETRTFLKINGNSYKQKGFVAGAFSTAGSRPLGTYTMTIENGDLKAKQHTLTIKENQTPIMIAYLEIRERKNGETEEEIEILQLPNAPKAQGFVYHAVYASNKPFCTLYIDGKPVKLESKKIVKLTAGGGLAVGVKPPDPRIDQSREQDPNTTSFTPEEPGNYLLVAYDAPGGGLKFALVDDRVYTELVAN